MAFAVERRSDADPEIPGSDTGAAERAESNPAPRPPRPRRRASNQGVADEASAATNVREWLAGKPLSATAHLVAGLLLPSSVLAAAMWRVRSFTIDDAYISYRYARNFARGDGLVYNLGERIEGYTNFLWTLLLGLGIKAGVDPDLFAKIFGALCAFGVLGVTFLLSRRLRAHGWTPCLATWLLASSMVLSGYAVFGLETSLFVLLLLGGTELMFREQDADTGGGWVPWSGLVFGFAGITRPEAPMYIGILMLFLGLRIFGRQNLLRGVLFALPVAAHVAFRHAYYGTWLPNTLSAKTGGNVLDQFQFGLGYVQQYVAHAGPVVWLAIAGIAVGAANRRRDILALAAIGIVVVLYVALVGGDWMPYFRFLSTFEPFCFLLVDVGARAIIDRRERAPNFAFGAFGVLMVLHRTDALRMAERTVVTKEERFWKKAAGGTADWLLQTGVPGEIAIGDIGYVGYATDYPVLDLLGLVDPVISQLPGAYTRKLGPGFTERFFDKAPLYFLLISSSMDCEHPSVPGSQVIYRDRRFRQRYAVGGKVPLDGGFAWCIYRRNP
jgi:hypothetical protein